MENNPSVPPKPPAPGGRQMPAWFSSDPMTQARISASTPPPIPVEPPPLTDESEYEEIDHLPRINGAHRNGNRRSRTCSLCGNVSAVVSCEMCGNQIFCGPCNDMYHRHPKRLHHLRKLIDAGESRPPLPPKVLAARNAQSDGVPSPLSSLPPVAPPRRVKRFPSFGMGMRAAASSPTLVKKTFDPMGTLKRFVGSMAQRPLPAPPKPPPPLPPKPTEFGRPTTPVMMGRHDGFSGFDRRQSSPSPMGFYPQEQQFAPQVIQGFPSGRNHSISVANLSMPRPPSRNMGYNEWDDQEFFGRQRAQSISVAGGRFPTSSQDSSHFATLQRPKKNHPSAEAPPPLPPRTPSRLGFQSSQSAFNLNHMGMPQQQFGGMPPWQYPMQGQGYPMDFQQAMWMGYPVPGGNMIRSPSNQSIGGYPPQFVGWAGVGGPMGFGPPMSQQEMEMDIMARRGQGPDPSWDRAPPPPRPSSVTQSQPVTPQGSFRRKTRPAFQPDPQRQGIILNDRYPQEAFPNQRSSTPRGFARVNASPIHFEEVNQTESDHTPPAEVIESPEGPWTCEHCTFINPKSTKICTICCKTPAGGYRSMGKSSTSGTSKGQTSRKASSSSNNDNEDIPVIQSKLSISRGEGQQEATINLVERVENVKTPNGKRPPSSVKKPKAVLNTNDDDDENDKDDENNAQLHKMKISTKKPKILAAKSHSSNEDVYGSVPLQALTISPKIEIRRNTKSVTSTGVGSSPPKPTSEIFQKDESSSRQASSKNTTEFQRKKLTAKASEDNSGGKSVKKANARNGSTSTSTTSSSSSSKSGSVKKGKKDQETKQIVNPSSSSKQTKAVISDAGESNPSGSSSSSPCSSIASSVALENLGKGINEKVGKKTSKGTSPPPQSISTQTYEDLPISHVRKHSASKTSMTSLQSFQSEDFAPRPIEMSEKALRYARKARHNHEAKLRRSLSTHLSTASDPWVENLDPHIRHLYRSSSRHSLINDTRSLPLSGPSSRESSPSRANSRFDERRRYPHPSTSWGHLPGPEDYSSSLEDLVANRRRRESVKSQEFELSRLLKEAEEYNYTPEDVQVALRMCGDRNPVKWLQENWSSMMETVQTLATKYGREKGESNQTGTISTPEAKDALRSNRGNVWAAVTECIEQRRRKFLELQSRGSFLREDILTALTANHGNLDAAYVELSKAQLKPFLMRIWGPPSGRDNEAVPPPPPSGDSTFDPELPRALVQSAVNQDGQELVKDIKTPKEVEGAIPQLQKTEENLSKKETEVKAKPKLNIIQSSTEKVSLEIQKAIKELMSSTNNIETVGGKDETASKVEKASAPSVNIRAIEEKISLMVQQALSEGPKSDEEESFVDALSAAESTSLAVSPMPPSEILESFENLEEDFHDLAIDDTGLMETKVGAYPDAQTQENGDNKVSLIPEQIVQPDDAQHKTIATAEETEIKVVPIEELWNDQNGPQKVNHTAKVINQESAISTTDTGTENAALVNPNVMNSVEIEQLINTLTTTFTEMGQFATEIKAQIASEIHNQLAVAVSTASTSVSLPSNAVEPPEIYEPIPASESGGHVNPKISKYKRLAGKKNQKLGRFKSPDARLSQASLSPSPRSSNSHRDEGSKSPFPVQIEIPDDGSNTEADEELPRDEEEYNSGSDETDYSSDDAQNSDESQEESEEDSEKEELLGQDGEYEEINLHQSANAEIINKDTEKVITEEKPKPHFSPKISEHKDVEALIEASNEPQEFLETEKSEKQMKVESLIAEGKVGSVGKAELALHLIDMNFAEEDSIQAAIECSSLDAALSFLQQECDLCTQKFSARQMVSMLRCTHVCCMNCAKEYFTVQIKDKSIVDATCPFCCEPANLSDNTDGATDYFSHLDILLKPLLEPRYHEMFQRKLRDWALAKTPNFKWCSKCSSGFITEPLQTRLICPDCNAVTCAICLDQWDKFNHNHKESKVKVCDSSTKTIVDYLNENSIECPRCHFRFALARGGCMHLTCTQCRNEFCSGCSAPFKMGGKCDAKLPICEKLGLHAHHPRNCLFYLRDKEPEILCKLLQENAIPFLKENSEATITDDEHANSSRTCQVAIQKETGEGLKDDVCGKDVDEGFVSVCKPHYVEYLGLLIWQNHLDPISILSNDDLEVIIRRANKKHPGRPYKISEEDLRNRLLKVIQEEIPL